MSSPSISGSEPGAGFRLLRLATGEGETLAVAELLVPAASPIFAGHFPGRPLLPGIAHLALLRQVLDELAARGELLGGGLEGPAGTAIAEVHRLRLRQPVSPGDHLELRVLAIDDAGTVRFEVRRRPADGGSGGEIAADGAVRCGAGEPPAAAAVSRSVPPDATAAGRDLAIAAAGRASPPPALAQRSTGPLADSGDFPEPASLLPHAPPARLLAAVLAADTGGITATGLIPADHPLAAGGSAPGFLALELAAQAAGAGEALARGAGEGLAHRAGEILTAPSGETRRSGGAARIGYLVGVRGARLPAALPTGRVLRVTAAPAGGAGALATYAVEVADAASGQVLAAGTISTFLPDA